MVIDEEEQSAWFLLAPHHHTHTVYFYIYIYPHVFRWFLLELFASPMLELFEGIYQRTGQNIDHVL